MSTLERTYQKGLADGKAETRSTLETTYQKGLAEGHAEGRFEGCTATILRLLQKRFGALPVGTSERVRAGSAADVERWTDRVLDSRTLADVFAD